MASGIIYSATFSGSSFAGVSANAVQDLFNIMPGSGVPIRLRRFALATTGQSSPGDLTLAVKRLPATVTVGSGGSAATVNEVASATGRAAAATVRTNDTTRATSSGTIQILEAITMQNLNNMDELRVPEMEELFLPGQACIIGLEVAPGSAVTVFGTVWFSELD